VPGGVADGDTAMGEAATGEAGTGGDGASVGATGAEPGVVKPGEDGPCETVQGAGDTLGARGTHASTPGEAGTSDHRAWGMHGRSTSSGSAVVGEVSGAISGTPGSGRSSRSSRRAPRPVPAPWLGNNAGEYAASTN
jgi:hypothetical protein